MKDAEILSVFPDTAARAAAPLPPARPLTFDACHAGVVLRAVLFAEAVVAVGAMFGSATPLAWALQFGMLTGAALPATLVWLIACCSAKHALAALRPGLQYAVAVGLGAVAGLYGCAMFALVGFAGPAPWFASAGAGALLAAVLVGGLVLRARGRTPAATAARLAELQSRIRPHFLFNTLNSAIALVRAEPARAEALLEDLADLFRHALAEGHEAVTLADEIALAERYLAIEQVRFGDRLRVQWAVDPQALGVQLPPLLLQPLVENAVVHGVEPSPAGGEVRIAAERRSRSVVVRIANTLPQAGTPARAGHGMALDNVRARLALLHDVHASLAAGVRDGHWQVRIELPLEAARPAIG